MSSSRIINYQLWCDQSRKLVAVSLRSICFVEQLLLIVNNFYRVKFVDCSKENLGKYAYRILKKLFLWNRMLDLPQTRLKSISKIIKSDHGVTLEGPFVPRGPLCITHNPIYFPTTSGFLHLQNNDISNTPRKYSNTKHIVP